jgi:oligoribonuclease NrnB/cAMP/cGMP phosphodiesterase (DHH superfamily)
MINYKIHIFYHSDLDGFGSGAIARLYYIGYVNQMVLHKIDYGQPFPWDEIKANDTVVMVDFTLQPIVQMIRLRDFLKDNGKLTWIDHHIEAIKSANELDRLENTCLSDIPGIRQSGRAAIELTWKYFFSEGKVEREPEIVTLLGRYDVWDKENKQFDWNDYILPFQKALWTRECDPAKKEAANFWFEAFFHPQLFAWRDYVAQGRMILEKARKDNLAIMDDLGFEAELRVPDGTFLKVIAVNRTRVSSLLFEGFYDKDNHEAMVAFSVMKTGECKFSIYSETKDVGAIAKQFGGGGHKGAAGFQIPLSELVDVLRYRNSAKQIEVKE